MENRVRKVRRNLEISQQELANRTGMARPSISNIENGTVIPSTETSLKIAKALGVKMDDLFFSKSVLHVKQEVTE